MSDWLDGLVDLQRRGEPAALVTVIDTRGSTPREAGAKMTVGLDGLWDSIGGGQLEHAAVESARLMLEQGGEDDMNTVERHELGPALGQCCGGVAEVMVERVAPGSGWVAELAEARRDNVTVAVATHVTGRGKHVLEPGGALSEAGIPGEWVERALRAGEPLLVKPAGGTRWFVDPLPAMDFEIVLFGAGHVGRATAGVLGTLPCRLTWVDSRREQFPAAPAANVRTRIVREPESLVKACRPGVYYLVMTHSHPLDLALCECILKRDDFAYCGLIGSASKRRNFEKRLRLKGITDSMLNRLTCPIGIEGITGKRPGEIAIAVAAEILQVREQMSRRRDNPGSFERWGGAHPDTLPREG